MKRVLIVAQAIPQWYVDTLTEALGENTGKCNNVTPT